MSDTTPTKDNQVKETTFTEAETKFLLAALKHAEGGTFKFDFAAVATELGLKDAASVRARWNTINRLKIQGAAGQGTAGGVDKASPGKTNKKPKDATPKTPKKRGRPSKADKEAAEKAAAEKAEDEAVKAEGEADADADEKAEGDAEEGMKPEPED